MHSKLFLAFALLIPALAAPIADSPSGLIARNAAPVAVNLDLLDSSLEKRARFHRGGGQKGGAGGAAGAGAGTATTTTAAAASTTAAVVATTTTDLAAVAASDIALAATAETADEAAEAADKSDPSDANAVALANANIKLSQADQAARAAEDAAGETITTGVGGEIE